MDSAKNFEIRQQFPHCLGVMDRKHIIIQWPFDSNSEHYNYKGTFSIVLLALVDSNYCFIYADVGCTRKSYNNLALPYVFLAHDAFQLSTKLLKPNPGLHKKDSIQRIFYYRLSRTRIASS